MQQPSAHLSRPPNRELGSFLAEQALCHTHNIVERVSVAVTIAAMPAMVALRAKMIARKYIWAGSCLKGRSRAANT